MASNETEQPPGSGSSLGARLGPRRRTQLAGVALALIVALGGYLRLADLGRAGLGNLFYASAVRSMGESWHNFLYAAYDPAATLNIDKPPLALWLQVLSTKLLGFEGWAIVLPMALAGTIAIPVVFLAGRRSHGVAVSLVAALLLAVFPESVATARDSTMDALVMLVVAIAAWLLIVAVEEDRPWLLVAWTALMGVAFNVKFFEGFVILPAAVLYVGWRWRDRWRKLVAPAAVAIAVGFVVSLSWVTVVELTPEDDRPLVMNDESNSEYGLVFRYNGLERVLPGEVAIFQPVGNAPASERLVSVTRSFGVGNRGVFRLFEDTNGPLIGSVVLLALAGLAVAAWRRRDWLLHGPGLLWAVWLITGAVLFSASNRAAAHYTESYAPAIAVLGAVGIVEAWRARGRWSSLVLPVAVLLLCVYLWTAYDGLEPLRSTAFKLAVAAAAVSAAAATALGLADRLPRLHDALRVATLAAILVVPFLTADWVAFDSPRGGQITRPNPVDYARADEPPPVERQVPAEAMVAHAEQLAPGTRYAFATTDINDAGESIAVTGASTLPLWNEYLRTPLFSERELDTRFEAGEIPFVLVEVNRARGGLLSEVMPVIERHCSITNIRGATSRFYQTWDCRETQAGAR